MNGWSPILNRPRTPCLNTGVSLGRYFDAPSAFFFRRTGLYDVWGKRRVEEGMMKIMDYLKEEWVIPDLKGTDKQSILRELSGVLVRPCQVASVEELLQVLLDREKLGSTGIGEGIAIPHGRLKKLKKFFISFGRSIKGVDFDSIDRNLSRLFFLVMAPENSAVDNLKLLSRIVNLLKDSSFKKRLIEASSQKELFQIISEEDEKY
jgi:PTS system nitrogen regulatory IIA component